MRADEVGYHRFAGITVGNAAELFSGLGDTSAALECAERSLRRAEALQDVLAVIHNAIVIADVRRRQGEPAEAERLLARVIEVARASDNRRYLAEAWLLRAHACNGLGEDERARRAADEALAIARSVGQSDLAARAEEFPREPAAPARTEGLVNPFAGAAPPPDPAQLVRRAEAALERWLAREPVK
jgi:tetratricopeptide (TPR) repeat protein